MWLRHRRNKMLPKFYDSVTVMRQAAILHPSAFAVSCSDVIIVAPSNQLLQCRQCRTRLAVYICSYVYTYIRQQLLKLKYIIRSQLALLAKTALASFFLAVTVTVKQTKELLILIMILITPSSSYYQLTIKTSQLRPAGPGRS